MYRTVNSNSDHQSDLARFTMSIWRRKWFLIFILVIFSSVTFVLIRQLNPEKPAAQADTYMDDVPDELYNQVLQTWYDFSGGEKWYNKKDISTHDSAFLKELRDNWIIWRNNPNESYALLEPDLKDPSMGQAQAIRDIFNDKRNGFFVECGAYDGETRSNTLVLERFYGWRGLLVEADPINFTKMLQKNRRAYLSPTCMSVQPRPMVASFLMARNIGRLHDPEAWNKTLVNTADVAHSGTHLKVQCFPFEAYIAALNVTSVDYFSLDIEGNEIEVLETIPFDKIDIKALSVEYSHNSKSRKYMIEMMEARGYYVHSFVEHPDNLANDIIFVKRGL